MLILAGNTEQDALQAFGTEAMKVQEHGIFGKKIRAAFVATLAAPTGSAEEFDTNAAIIIATPENGSPIDVD